jgi:formylglycine-generating enzyme required for sulfatase activity
MNINELRKIIRMRRKPQPAIHSETPTVNQRALREERLKREAKQDIVVNGVPFAVRYVRGGQFSMGIVSKLIYRNDWGEADERPVHTVRVSSFCMGDTPVTQALWKAVMGDNPSVYKGDNLPVDSVSWYDCQEFLQRLNELTGKEFRLPTEAEWEYAARGGCFHTDFVFANEDYSSDVVCNSYLQSNRVKSCSPNILGLYDMSGNVWEWCDDWYDENYYKVSQKNNPRGPRSGEKRVVRGGSWCFIAHNCRVTHRAGEPPQGRFYDIGLRVVLV